MEDTNQTKEPRENDEYEKPTQEEIEQKEADDYEYQVQKDSEGQY